jgi:TatD DNase family protein
LDILRGFRNSLGGGVIHCFTGTWELAKGALDLGLDISISGIITFKKAEELRDVIRKIPLDRLHLETDAPYLSPVPHRGKANESSFLPHTAQVLADLKQVSLEELANQVQKNNRRIFPRLFLKDLLEDV